MKSLSPVIARLRKRMKPRRDFPAVKSPECWREGWLTGNACGIVIGAGMAVIFLLKR